MVKISVLTFFIAFPADIRSRIQREYESHMSRPLKWSWAWRCLQFLCAGDQGWCGSIYEFLKFPICIPYQITSSLAIIFCFGGAWHFPPLTSKPSLKSFSLLSAKPYPSNQCSGYSSSLKLPHTILPGLSSLCSAWFSLNTCVWLHPAVHPQAPILMPVLVLYEMMKLKKGVSGSSTSGTPHYILLLLAQNGPSIRRSTAGLRCRISLGMLNFLGNLHLRLQSSGCATFSNLLWVMTQSWRGHLCFFHLPRLLCV